MITDYLGRAPLPPTGLAAGSYKVTASFAGNATYTAASSTQDLVIAAQEINFGGAGLPDSITYPGSTKFTVTSTSGQPVTVGLEPNPSPYCTLASMPVTGGTEYTLTAVAAGLCRVVLTAGATTTYAEVLVTKDIAIKFGQVISFGALATKTYGDPPFTVSATGGASGNPVTFSSTTLPVCTVSGATVTILAAGSCTIAADQAGADFYNAAPQVTQTFTVNKAAQTISFGALAAKTYGAAPFIVSATSSSGLPVSFAASGNCTVAGNLVTITGAGSCTITASQAGDGNYQPATSVPQTFAIAPAAQTITWPTIPAQTYAPGGTFGLTATATGGGTVTFTSLATGVCTVAGTTATIVTAGDCVIRADQSGAPNYVAATAQQTVAINKAAQTISFAPISPPTFVTGGTGTFAVSATATSSLTVVFSSSTLAVCTVSGTTVTMKSGRRVHDQCRSSGRRQLLRGAAGRPVRHHRQGGADDHFRGPGRPDVHDGADPADRDLHLGADGGVRGDRQLHGVRVDADADRRQGAARSPRARRVTRTSPLRRRSCAPSRSPPRISPTSGPC